MSRAAKRKRKKTWKPKEEEPVYGITLINNQEVDLKGSTPIAEVTRGDKDLLGKLRLYV